MITLRQGIHDFITKLELTDSEQEAASTQHVYLRDGLAKQLTLDPKHNTFLTGSYSRSTAIRPLKDIDVFCVLNSPIHLWPNINSPSDALNVIKRALDNLYPGKVAAPQNRSVNIEFSGTGIAYDVVPAFVDSTANDEIFLIPDISAGKWICSNPRIHKNKSISANEVTNSELKPLTKAIKHWNRQFDKNIRLRSFHIEIMAWDVLTQPPESRLSGLVTLFDGLANRVLRSTPDPAKLGPDIDADLTTRERQDARKRFIDAASNIKEAQTLAADGKVEAAHYIMHQLFGEPYPEKGKQDTLTSKPTSVFPSAPDGSGSRFG